MHSPEIRPYGSSAILLQWADNQTDLHLIIPFWLEELTAVFGSHSEDITNGYSSIVLFLKSPGLQDKTIKRLSTIDFSIFKKRKTDQKKWKIPVLYDLNNEWDLLSTADYCNLSQPEVVHIHSLEEYTVRFIGFLPGFVYLDGLSDQLNIPRKKKPRAQVPVGAVGIGGNQTGIYPGKSPGGWQIIGQTPIPLFDVTQTSPSPFKIGDSIQFSPIDSRTFETIRELVKQNRYSLDQLKV